MKVRYNWKTLVGFEILYKMVAAVIIVPLFAAMFNGVMHLAGYEYLTLENVKSFAGNWMTIALFALLAVIISIVCLFDIGAVLFILDGSERKEKVTMHQAALFAWEGLRRALKKKNVFILLFILLMTPFLNAGTIPSYVSMVSVPGFVVSYIKNHRPVVAAVCLGWIFMTFFLLRWLFLVPYFILEKMDLKEACRRSAELIRGRCIKDAVFLLLVQLGFYLCFFVFSMIGVVLVLLFGKIFSELRLINVMEASAIWGLIFVIFSIVFALGIPISYGCISWLFYRHKKKKQEALPQRQIQGCGPGGKARKKILVLQTILFAAAVFGYTNLVYRNSAEKVELPIEYLHTVEVTAHRGASMFCPENTMAAFEAAVEQGADWIELDVQQSGDGQIFVMHDRNFKRTTGVDKYSWELDYAEIKKLGAGKRFGPEFANERIPLLKDVIEFAKENDVRLNIELKPAGFETDFEKKVVDIICEMEFQDMCVLTSQQYETLVNIKEYCEDISTVYVMNLAYGNVNRLTCADKFSMEASSVTPGMVTRVHNAGKELYAWTVNRKNVINRMIDLNVDNIITDNVPLVQKCVYESKTSDVIQKFVRFVRIY